MMAMFSNYSKFEAAWILQLWKVMNIYIYIYIYIALKKKKLENQPLSASQTDLV